MHRKAAGFGCWPDEGSVATAVAADFHDGCPIPKGKDLHKALVQNILNYLSEVARPEQAGELLAATPAACRWNRKVQ